LIRKQVYLTEEQNSELNSIAKASGKKQSELIRIALNRFIDQESQTKKEMILRKTAGIWKDRKDLPDFHAIRREWDR
jgi:hypothetical protein